MAETNGFIKLPRKVSQARARLNIPPNARQILDVIDDKTYGWNKDEDWISHTQLAKLTGLNRSHISRNVAKLEAMNLIIVTRIGAKNDTYTGANRRLLFKVNQDTDLYRCLAPKRVSRGKGQLGTNAGVVLTPIQASSLAPVQASYNSTLTKESFTIETTVSKKPKKRNTKSQKALKVVVHTPKSDHRQAISYFCDTYKHEIGSKYLFNDKKDGAAFKRLLSNFGLDRLMLIIDQQYKTEDKWIKEKGITVGILQSCANQLNQEIESGPKIPGLSAQTQQNIKNIMGAMGD